MKAKSKKPPQELESIWDKETAEAWESINENQKKFVIEWLSNGFNATQAYRTAYETLSNDNVCGVNGYNLLRNPKLQSIFAKLNNMKASDLAECFEVQRKAMKANKAVFSKDGEMVMEIEDHKTRMEASMNLMKIHGELVDKQKISGDGSAPLVVRITKQDEGL